MKKYRFIGGSTPTGLQVAVDKLMEEGDYDLIGTEIIDNSALLTFKLEKKPNVPGFTNNQIIREPINCKKDGGTSLKTLGENVGDLLSPLRITWDGEESTYNYITLLLGDSFKYHHYNNGILLIEGRKSNYEMELDLGWVIDINKDGFSCRDPR